MTKTEILELLNSMDMGPSKKLGQNFLIDQNIIDIIVDKVVPSANENVLEIGPGTGVLTKRLVESGATVTAVEFDYRLAEYIRKTYGPTPGFRLIEKDAVKVDYDELMEGKPFRCIANLPYAISSIFLATLTNLQLPPAQIFVMLQKEMADRLAAEPRTKAYGALSVRIQAVYDVSIAKVVSNQSFYPAPDVDSALLNAELKTGETLSVALRQHLATLSKLAFSHRRKQVKKVLATKLGMPRVLELFEQLGILVTARAEEITVPQFIELSKLTLDEAWA
ncbi:MAG: ribosomal RNA small subunit methyltransferase A [Lentisphaeria bacterium]|nr:ribosomal RNA small subunit methyltransferase A [Lentisphaeria bacterium]